MNRRLTIRRLFAILVIAGLVLAPLSRPVMASNASMPAAAGMSVSAAADQMAGEMPCCPGKAAVPIDCSKCVLMAGCVTKCSAGLPMAELRPRFDVSSQIAPPPNEARPDGLDHLPPEHIPLDIRSDRR